MGGRKHKGRSKRNAKLRGTAESEAVTTAPHTFVFHRGTRCVNVQALLSDLRAMLEPFTATNLRITRRNVLKDVTTVAGIFHVSHLWILSRSSQHMSLRIAGLPAGPTITFKIAGFATIRDIRRSSVKPVSDQSIFGSAPLLILSRSPTLSASAMSDSKSKKDKVYQLISTLVQRSFPSMDVDNVKLNKIKRCVLRLHKQIDTVNIAVRRLLSGRSLPDLSNCSDVSDFVYQPCLSESEDEERVELPQDINHIHTLGNQSALKLREIGPRLDLELRKIEDDVCGGNKLWPPQKLDNK